MILFGFNIKWVGFKGGVIQINRHQMCAALKQVWLEHNCSLIHTIKVHRSMTGLGLADSRDYCRKLVKEWTNCEYFANIYHWEKRVIG